MRICLLCATQRGYRFLQRLIELAPDAELIVCSFPEEPWEPPFMNAIKELTLAHGGQFFAQRHVGRLIEVWQAEPIDLLLTVSWRYIIPPEVYLNTRLGAFLLHDSLLPAYRGFAPTVWAMINGEDHTGVTLLEMVEDFDAGGIIGQEYVPIGSDETIAQVLNRVTEVYLHLLEEHLPALLAGTAPRRAQDASQATYTVKLTPDDFLIDWNWPTTRIYNLIRATTAPYAGAYTFLDGQRLTVWAARQEAQPRQYVGRIPGRVAARADDGVVVLTGDGSLLLTEVQLAGEERLPTAQVLRSIAHTLGR
jgi:methionyl-tRNA formyltransferase